MKFSALIRRPSALIPMAMPVVAFILKKDLGALARIFQLLIVQQPFFVLLDCSYSEASVLDIKKP